jgi:hypothetical protein
VSARFQGGSAASLPPIEGLSGQSFAAPRGEILAHDGLAVTPWSEGRALWRLALTRLSGASFYHCERWIDVLQDAYPVKLEVATLHRAGELRAAAVVARSKRFFTTWLISLPFADSSAPLARDDESRADFMRALVAANPAARIEIRGVAGPALWENVDCFGHWTLDLRRPFSEIKAGFGRTVRIGIKRAVRDKVQIECHTDRAQLARYFDLQLITRRRLGVPPQPFKFFAAVYDGFARTGDIEIRFATYQGRDHAGAILLRSADQVCYKWAARLEGGHPGANHMLVADMIEAHAERATTMDFGRCDKRNAGLVRSKADLGCAVRPLPYAFFPGAPRNVSSEVLRGPARILSSMWKRLPLPLTRVLGEILYRYVA